VLRDKRTLGGGGGDAAQPAAGLDWQAGLPPQHPAAAQQDDDGASDDGSGDDDGDDGAAGQQAGGGDGGGDAEQLRQSARAACDAAATCFGPGDLLSKLILNTLVQEAQCRAEAAYRASAPDARAALRAAAAVASADCARHGWKAAPAPAPAPAPVMRSRSGGRSEPDRPADDALAFARDGWQSASHLAGGEARGAMERLPLAAYPALAAAQQQEATAKRQQAWDAAHAAQQRAPTLQARVGQRGASVAARKAELRQQQQQQQPPQQQQQQQQQQFPPPASSPAAAPPPPPQQQQQPGQQQEQQGRQRQRVSSARVSAQAAQLRQLERTPARALQAGRGVAQQRRLSTAAARRRGLQAP
jgi:hypothetical protein